MLFVHKIMFKSLTQVIALILGDSFSYKDDSGEDILCELNGIALGLFFEFIF